MPGPLAVNAPLGTAPQELLEGREKNMHIQSALLMLGYNYVTLTYNREERRVGKSSWTLAKSTKLMIDSFVGYSYAPIRLMSFAGLVTAALSVSYGLFVVVMTLAFGRDQPGWASVIALLAFLQGMTMTMMGIMGEYIWRTLDEVRARKPYVVESSYEHRPEDSCAE